ncbi:hypothetical protein EIP86_010035 [Pleurotus ostreatoroseus]|nr:hypothetical protein EIP86_010035 [Pleurotus ostreatoroseus]
MTQVSGRIRQSKDHLLPAQHQTTAMESTYVPHHDPPLVSCVDCQRSLRLHASREVCRLFSNLTAQPQAKRKPAGNVGWDSAPRAPVVSSSQLSSIKSGSADNSSSQSISPATNGLAITAADLAAAMFYKKPNQVTRPPPLHHPRPIPPMTAAHIPWLETRPSLFMAYSSTRDRVQLPSPYGSWRPSSVAPPSGIVVAKIMTAEREWLTDPFGGRKYTRDLVQEEDVKILPRERVLRTEIGRWHSQETDGGHIRGREEYHQAKTKATEYASVSTSMATTKTLTAAASFSWVSAPHARDVPLPVFSSKVAMQRAQTYSPTPSDSDDESDLENTIDDINLAARNYLPSWMCS